MVVLVVEERAAAGAGADEGVEAEGVGGERGRERMVEEFTGVGKAVIVEDGGVVDEARVEKEERVVFLD